jgi:hypothetical protein
MCCPPYRCHLLDSFFIEGDSFRSYILPIDA